MFENHRVPVETVISFTAVREISKLLNTGLSPETLAICVRLCESGVNPEPLAMVIQELKKETAALKVSHSDEVKVIFPLIQCTKESELKL